MTSSIIFSICSFVYIVLIGIVYLSKSRMKNEENRLYIYLIISNFVGLTIEVFSTLLRYRFPDLTFLFNLCLKLILVYFIVWPYIFLLYIISVCKKRNINRKISVPVLIAEVLITFILPFNIKYKNGIVSYTYGLGVNVNYIIGVIDMILCLYFIIKYRKNMEYKKMLPVILFLILGSISALINKYNPELLIMSSVETLITVLMYFTIENPDMKMVEALQKAKDDADRANHAKTDFLSSMSHEIRTPLNAIVGFSDCVNNASTLDEAKENAKDIVNASKTLLEIVNGILDISKIESGKLELNLSSYDARSTFEELATLVEGKAKEKGIKFTYYIDPIVPKVLYGDYNNVKKIITNLLSNAVKYTDKGFIRYEITCVNTDDMCRLIVSVEDSGRGIKKEAVDHLFTKFQRLDEDKNTTIEGTGLGLAITKQLVEMMGGKIVVHTVYGSGSKFTAMIPQKISNEVIEVEPEVKKEVKVLKKDVNLSGVKILIVDDNNLNLKVASKLLERYGADNITTVNSGFECLDKISKGEKYDLIFMDDMMPKMSGAETFSKLKEMPGFITPVVALTANAISGMRENYLELGFDEYLAKPIEKDALIKVLNKVLEEKEEIVTNVVVVENKELEKNEQSHEEYLRSNGVNIDKALELLGDMNMYEVTLKDFLNEIDNRWERIKKYKESGDLENYAVEVHSLKSDCKYLGFTKLANTSFLHELKSKDKDKEYVDKHFKDLEEAKNVAVKIMKGV